jgi:hypothetical protein
MSNQRVKKAIAACHKRHEDRRKIQLFAVKYCISNRVLGLDGENTDDDLKATLEEWAMAFIEMKYREDLLLRFIDERTDGDLSEAKDFLDSEMPASREVWRNVMRKSR